jgi:hypothetical protein
MEAEVITNFLPSLITVISDIVQPVSDQCLAKGLIPESVYKRVLESGGTSDDKARTLVLAVKSSTETDSRCLEILLNILERELPLTIRDKLLSEIRKEISEKANTCREVVLHSGQLVCVPSEDLPRESTAIHTQLLGRLEDSIRQYEQKIAIYDANTLASFRWTKETAMTRKTSLFFIVLRKIKCLASRISHVLKVGSL